MWRMRKPRALAEPGRPGLYHVCSRVVDRRAVFGAGERRRFLFLTKSVAAFAGVDVVSWCLMSNHFHLLVRVSALDPKSLSDEEVLSRMEHIYAPARMRHFRGVWERLGTAEARLEFLAPFRARMANLSEFVKTVKQRFTQWYNHRNDRDGTLWECRFHSVLLFHNEADDGNGLGILARFVAGYIDLNPVRAGIVPYPEQSDWSGFGAASRGDPDGVAGLRILWGRKATDHKAAEAVLQMHEHMMRQALARDSDQVPGKGKSKEKPPIGARKNAAAGALGFRASPHRETSDERRGSAGPEEAQILSRMAERCVELTKGHVLGKRWLIERSL